MIFSPVFSMTVLFIARDRHGRAIRLTHTQWKHIVEHPEMSDQIERIKETIELPHVIHSGKRDPNIRYYFRYYKKTPATGNYLLVAVKYLNGDGFVITAFYATKARL